MYKSYICIFLAFFLVVSITAQGAVDPLAVLLQEASATAPGVNVDRYGNTFEGTQQNGLYLFCNGEGCPGRGRK